METRLYPLGVAVATAATLMLLGCSSGPAAHPIQDGSIENSPTSQEPMGEPSLASSAELTVDFDSDSTLEVDDNWKVHLEGLRVDTSAIPDGPVTHIKVSLSARGSTTLLSSYDEEAPIGSRINSTPYWARDSATCNVALTPGNGQLAALGVGVATSAADWVAYRDGMPFCGLNWNGYNIEGVKGSYKSGDVAPLAGTEFSFEVDVPSDQAEATVSSLVNPAGWMFNMTWREVKSACGLSFGMGKIIYTTTGICDY